MHAGQQDNGLYYTGLAKNARLCRPCYSKTVDTGQRRGNNGQTVPVGVRLDYGHDRGVRRRFSDNSKIVVESTEPDDQDSIGVRR